MNLLKIQSELKAPKGQYNSFGNYKYRSCEDILESVKPLLSKYKCELTISDDIVTVSDRIYVKATATLIDGEKTHTVTAFARESLNKKGMDDSQITGTASSYARKYALNGLFLIDDTKDADTDEYHKKTEQQSNEQKSKSNEKITKTEQQLIKSVFEQKGKTVDDALKWFKVKDLSEITDKQYTDFFQKLNKNEKN